MRHNPFVRLMFGEIPAASNPFEIEPSLAMLMKAAERGSKLAADALSCALYGELPRLAELELARHTDKCERNDFAAQGIYGDRRAERSVFP